MFIEQQSYRWLGDAVEAFDPLEGEFYPLDFAVRISVTDQFLSNFNRPLRRRMIHYPVNSTLPDSLTVKVISTQEVYLLGQAREDSDFTGAYHRMAVGHLVTDEGVGSSSGLARQYRHSPDGPPENPGWLTEKYVSQTYMDLEFRTSLNEADLTDSRVESFIGFFPRTFHLEDQDRVEFKGKDYRVTDVYSDSGFMMARLDREPSYYVDLVFKLAAERVYNSETLRWETTQQSVQVTGKLTSEHDYVTWSTDSDDTLNLSINRDHIGFRPVAGMEIEWQGRTRTVRHVHFYRGERQYKLRCR